MDHNDRSQTMQSIRLRASRCLHKIYGLAFWSFCLGLALVLLPQRVEQPVEAAPAHPAQSSPDGIWLEFGAGSQQGAGKSVPATARIVRLNRAALVRVLNRAPLEGQVSLAERGQILTLPMPDGSFARFRLEESPAMEPGLAARFPEIKSYRGQGVDEPAMTMRCDWSPNGFHALVLTGNQTVNIHPLGDAGAGGSDIYASYFGDDIQKEEAQCFTSEIHKINPGQSRANGPLVAIGATLRTYRIAISATWEYCNSYGGGTNAGTVASINTWVNSANAVYERELAIHLNLVNNTNILFTTERGFSSGTDPFTNSNVNTMIGEVRPVLRDQAGQANYDLGYVLGLAASGASGVSFIGVVCDNTGADGLGPLKGGGAATVSGAAGSSVSLGIWVHEIGHQFGANHSFNGTFSNCTQRNAGTAYESGSGETIMAYSGICGADNIATSRDMRFHTGSYAEITSYILSGNGGTCATTSATGNNPPTVNGGGNFTIPKNTPFTLTATGNDADTGDASNLTYAWDQVDSGGPGTTFAQNGTSASYNDDADPPTTTRPIFRPFPVSPSPSRTFPSLSYILNNANDPPDTAGGLQTAEELPRIARTLDFRVTIRDNRAGGGGVNEDSVQLTVASSGPFLVTAPNTAVTWTGGTSQNVTWSVNGTNGAPVNAANVKITLSTDGGITFPVTLAASTPNDGTQSITVPNGIITSTARVKIEAIGNIFFDISDTNFSITPGDGCPAISGINPQAGNAGTSVVITGINFTGVTTVKFSNNVSASFTVNNNTQITATVPAGAATGPITISKAGCADSQTGTFYVFLLPPVTLAVDDGSYETASNYGSGGTIYFVNRPAPASYPATLSQVSIFFAAFTNVTAGTPITVVAGTNTDGDANINNTQFQTLNTTVQATGQFNNYAITPITINSGDFVVGFGIAFSGSQFPALRDTTVPNNGRSYASTDGVIFSTIDSLGFAGDLGIRAQIFLGGGGCSYSLAPTSQNFAAVGGSNSVTVTTTAGCAWMATSNDGWIVINSGSIGLGSGTVNYTVAANNGPQRTGTMTIADQTFTVTQDSGCPAINLSPTTLPNGTIGGAYNQIISATGGTSPYTFAVISGSLPNGLTLSASGVLSGTPTVGGTFNFTVQAIAANGCTGTRAYTIQITCPAITVNPATLPNGTTGTAYNQAITATSGTGPYNFVVSGGALPTGLSLSSAGTLSGTPAIAGIYNFMVQATDANDCSGTRGYTVQITCPTITVNPATLPNGTAGAAYSQTATATGGTAPYNFTISAGALPAGITLSSAGALSGTPTATGTFNFTVQARDANNCTGSRAYTLQITCPTISIAPTVLPDGEVGTPYSQTLTGSGGVAPYSFSILTGALPAGLTLSLVGALSGTPTAFGTFNFIVQASDANNCTGTRNYVLTINQTCPAITVNPPSLPNGTVGTSYNQTLTATGGAPAYTYTVMAGALPTSLNLSTTGNLSGTPTTAGTFNFTVLANDANNCSGTRSYTVIISGGSGTGLMFYPFAHPVRLLDTRSGQVACDAPGAPIAGGTSRTQTAAGRTCDGVSIPAAAKAIIGNITTVQSGGGYLTLYPSDAAQPLVANSNYSPNEIVNNVFTVGLGAGDGAFKIFATSDTYIVVDVTGYYAPPGAGGLYFHTLPHPVRLLETRAGLTGCLNPGTPLPGNVETTQQARGVCDGVTIPNAALAIVGNATTVNPQGPGFPFLTLFPADAARPLVASSNYLPGQVMNAPFTVGLSANGAFKIFPTTQTDLVIDVLGYYSTEVTDVNGAGLLFNPLPKPVRLLETRAGFTGCYITGVPLVGGITRTQPAQGLCNGVTIASNALAVIGNATVIFPQSGGYLTFWPSDAAQPTVAASNFAAGQVFNRHFTVGLGSADGAFKIFTSATTDLVIDVSGFFAP